MTNFLIKINFKVSQSLDLDQRQTLDRPYIILNGVLFASKCIIGWNSGYRVGEVYLLDYWIMQYLNMKVHRNFVQADPP